MMGVKLSDRATSAGALAAASEATIKTWFDMENDDDESAADATTSHVECFHAEAFFRRARAAHANPPRPERLSVGPQTDVAEPQTVRDRGVVRGRRRDRSRRPRVTRRGARRLSAASRFHRGADARRRLVRYLRRHHRYPRQTRSPPSARLRQRGSERRRSGPRELGETEERGAESGEQKRPRRRPAIAACAAARIAANGESSARRLRLAPH